jgi:enterochelin esterase family protein
MLVVMPNGSLPRPATARGGSGPGRGSPQFAAAKAALQGRYAKELLENIVPYVEKNYRVLPGGENRAVAGLSMGGGETLGVVTHHPDQFGYVGVWSAGIFGDAAEFEKRNITFFDSAEKVARRSRCSRSASATRTSRFRARGIYRSC